MTEPAQTTEREVFRFEVSEGRYIRLILCGEPDRSLMDGLMSFIKQRKRLLQQATESTIDG
jgi:hypothetical protein